MINKHDFLLGNPDNLLVSETLKPDPHVNSKGYRAPEFNTVDWENSVVIFGCSFVYGTAIGYEETISSHLEEILGRPVINMGVPASSIAYAFANQLNMFEQGIQPYAVVNFWTSLKRMSYFIDTNATAHIGPWIEEKNKQSLNHRLYKKMFELWNFEDANPDVYSSIFQRTAKILWKGTRHLEYSFFAPTAECLNVKLIKQIDFGSDNSHPGVRTTFETAKIIAEDLESK